MSSNVQAVELVFLLLLLFVVAFGALARKLQIPYPIVLVIAGGLLGFVPGIPRIALNPDVIFFVILPPLLYSAAWYLLARIFLQPGEHPASGFWLGHFHRGRSGSGTHWLLSGFDWKLGLVLGAVIAPTDALAAASIAKRVGIPKRITDVLEGESLVNDASGLLALDLASQWSWVTRLPRFPSRHRACVPDLRRPGRRPDHRLDRGLGRTPHR